LPLLEADPGALLSSIAKACSWGMSAKGEITFIPGFGVEFTDDISGKLDSICERHFL